MDTFDPSWLPANLVATANATEGASRKSKSKSKGKSKGAAAKKKENGTFPRADPGRETFLRVMGFDRASLIIEPEHTALRAAADAMNWVAVGQLLEQNVPVTKLFLPFAIGETGAARLAAALETNTTLMELRINGNKNMGGEGAARFAVALEKNTTLTTLDLSGHGFPYAGRRSERGRLSDRDREALIGNEGAAHLAAALEKNRALTTLNLSGNGIKFEGAARLVAALEKNRALTTLNLSGNKLLLAARVEENTTLEYKNPTLEWFNFSENVGRDDLIRHWGGTPLKWHDMESHLLGGE